MLKPRYNLRPQQRYGTLVSLYQKLLKTGLGTLDFWYFDWLIEVRLSAHKPAVTKYDQYTLDNKMR